MIIDVQIMEINKADNLVYVCDLNDAFSCYRMSLDTLHDMSRSDAIVGSNYKIEINAADLNDVKLLAAELIRSA